MGDFAIVIHGVGIHHNGLRADADQMAADFVQKLKEAGHSLTQASITIGGKADLLNTASRLPLKE